MKKALLLTVCFLLFVFSLACGNENPGIGTGNPSVPSGLVGQLIRVVPTEFEEVYLATIDSETAATVEQVGTTTESQSSSISNITETSFEIQATFSDGTDIVLQVAFTATTITSVTLIVNSLPADSTFSVESAVAGCATTTTNAALQLVNETCNAIVDCHAEITCDACRTGMLGTNQLTNDFGVPVPENSLTMQEIADGVDAGTFTAQTSPLNQCLSDLAGLTCTDVAIGFSTADPTNYDNVENFIPAGVTSCRGVFAP